VSAHSQELKTIYYSIDLSDKILRHDFSADEKALLRPVAETLAMLDGNAFLSAQHINGQEWYEQYLPEAWIVWQSNGGKDGWAGTASFARLLQHENSAVEEAYNNWQTLKRLYSDK
jgi:hypothetical protein